MDERILLDTVKRTGFSAPGDKPGKFAESGAGLGFSGSRQAHKRRVTPGFFRSLRIVGKYYRLCGGARRIRTAGALLAIESRNCPQHWRSIRLKSKQRCCRDILRV